MRIERETEVTIKVKIGYVWPDDFESESGVYQYNTFRTTQSASEFVNSELLTPEQARDLIMNMYEKSSDLLQFADISVRDMGIVRE